MGLRAQRSWVYFIIDCTGEMGDRIELLNDQLNARIKAFEQAETGSRATTTVITMGDASCRLVPRQRLEGFHLSRRPAGCDLSGALLLLESSLRDSRASADDKVEIVVLLNREPVSGWENQVQSLQSRRLNFTAIDFSGESKVRRETVKRIASQKDRALRLDAPTRENIQTALDYVFSEILGMSPVRKEARPATSSLESGPPSPQPHPQAMRGHTVPLPKRQLSPEKEGTARPPEQTPETAAEEVAPRKAELAPADQTESAVLADQEAHALQQVAQPTATDARTGDDQTAQAKVPGKAIKVRVSARDPDAQATADEMDTGSVDEALTDQPSEQAVEEMQPEPDVKPPPIDEEGVATIWKELEPPAELGDRVGHVDTDEKDAPGNWKLIGASRRGKMHAHKGIFREDAFVLGEEGGWHLAVVADGGGSCSLSRVGSHLASETAVARMVEIIQGVSGKQLLPEEIAELALQQGLKVAWEALASEAEKREINLRELGTTYLALMHHPSEEGHVVGVAQVGDGLVAAELANGKVVAMAEPDVGETAGVTLFLTSKHWEEWLDRVNVVTLDVPPRLLTAMCDGVADDFIPYEEYLGKLFERLSWIIEQEDPKQALLRLLGYEKRGSFDDRTLALIYQTDGRPSKTMEPVPEAETALQEREEMDGGSQVRESTPDRSTADVENDEESSVSATLDEEDEKEEKTHDNPSSHSSPGT